jgi:hypothetical protein
MIEHKLPNKIKSATVAEPKLFHQLNNPIGVPCHLLRASNSMPMMLPGSSVESIKGVFD